MRAAVRWSFFKNLPHPLNPEIGGYERGLFLVSFVHQGEKQPDLYGFDLYVSNFVDHEAVAGEVLFEGLLFGVVCHGLI